MGADVGNNPSTMPPIGAPPLTRAAADLRVVEGPIGRRSESGVFFCENRIDALKKVVKDPFYDDVRAFWRNWRPSATTPTTTTKTTANKQICLRHMQLCHCLNFCCPPPLCHFWHLFGSTRGKKPLTTNFVDPADSRYSTLADINKEIFVQKTPAQQQRSQAVPYGPYSTSATPVKPALSDEYKFLPTLREDPPAFPAQAAPPTSVLASPTISAKPTAPAKATTSTKRPTSAAPAPTTSAKMITSTKPTTSAPSDSPSASGKSSTLAAPKDMASSMSAPIIAEATAADSGYSQMDQFGQDMSIRVLTPEEAKNRTPETGQSILIFVPVSSSKKGDKRR
ncbi:hypothetical protein niasHS_009370 [Heterodera schachtii]|uniref:Uncharacterized protein n=1 Tax=Heterodera schachtii TaxID=97005 RepID=A0ABD2JBT9_HETSC